MFPPQATQRYLAADRGAGSGGAGPTTSMAEAGMVLGDRYQLVSPIASGGMAQVWQAQDLSLIRQVAIKILHPHLATDAAFVARFRREAVASAKLSHRSIVAIYDTLSEGGIEAIVMELIEGRTLRAVLDEAGVLPPADVVDVGIQISAALDEAHRAGIVHRDIKPANIMVSADRRIMVTDFGIAKAQKDADLTHTGTLLGTAKYLAPEQVAGEPVDPRADIYALGVVLFEAATGKAPFVAETDAGTALARLQGEVPHCRHRRPSVPVGLDRAIARSMARNPHDRFDRASSFRAALAAVDLSDVRPDTSDLGPAMFGTGPNPLTGSNPGTGPNPLTGPNPRTGTGSHPPVQPPGLPIGAPLTPPLTPPPTGVPIGPPPSVPPPVAPNSGTAILTPQADLANRQVGGIAPGPNGTRPGRRDRKAAKRAAKSASKTGRRPAGGAMPIDGRQRPTKTIVVALIVGGLVVSGVLLASLLDPDGGAGGGSGSGAAPVMIDAAPFDPRGDGTERADIAPLSIDGDPETLWRTDTYKRAGLGGLKPGVGLILTLESESSVNTIEFLTANEGWDAQIHVGDDFGPNDPAFDIGALGEPAGTIQGGGVSESVSLDGASGSKILLWITETGRTLDRNDIEVFRFVLFEVSVS